MSLDGSAALELFMSDTPAPASPAAAPRKRFGCLSIILGLVAVLLLAAAVAIWMAKSEPAAWTDVNEKLAALSVQEKEDRAESLQKRLLGESQGFDAAIGPVVTPGIDLTQPIERDVTITVADANIWLATRLEDTLAQAKTALPKVMSDPRVWIEGEQIVLSARVELPDVNINGVVSFGLAAQMQPDGRLTLRIDSVRTGKLPVPQAIVAEQVREELKDVQAEAVKMVGQAFDGVTIDPVFADQGDKSRQTRVLAFKIHPDRVELKLRNEPKGATAKE